ncbi:hypothetical protein [Sphingomonas sp. URHD0057]|uniref:hypothetical protein n=1 Tax=Sphingomonas sp. URHD0057 TaxID=1380389 RepID=UPI00048F078D|nr:hypothetical protein [Sphingomonas sp. URHD0057]
MLFVLFVVASAPPLPRLPAVAQATARGRVIRGEPASREWKEGSAHKREILVREADGSLTRLRLVEHE